MAFDRRISVVVALSVSAIATSSPSALAQETSSPPPAPHAAQPATPASAQPTHAPASPPHAASAQSTTSGTASAPTTPPPQAAAALPTAAPPLTPVPAPSTEELQRRRVPVRLDSTRDGTVLQRRVSTSESGGTFLFIVPFHGKEGTWEDVCVSPCRADLDRYSTYRIAGQNNTTQSMRFTLPQAQDSVHLKVDAGNQSWNHAGRALVGIGTAALIVGGGLLATSTAFKNEDHARTAGWITGGAGIVTLGIGIPLMLLTRTHVKLDDGRCVAGGQPGAIAF